MVSWGLKNRSLKGITAIGVDERWLGRRDISISLSSIKLINPVYDSFKDRKEKSFSKFFDKLGEDKCQVIEFVCSDMWKPYLKVIKERIGGAIHILDRFHIVANLIRFHGVFAPNFKHRCLITPKTKSPEKQTTKSRNSSSMTWAMRLKRVFGMDIEICSECGGKLKVISSIEER